MSTPLSPNTYSVVYCRSMKHPCIIYSNAIFRTIRGICDELRSFFSRACGAQKSSLSYIQTPYVRKVGHREVYLDGSAKHISLDVRPNHLTYITGAWPEFSKTLTKKWNRSNSDEAMSKTVRLRNRSNVSSCEGRIQTGCLTRSTLAKYKFQKWKI